MSKFLNLFFKKPTKADPEIEQFMVERFGHTPKNGQLFLNALTHKSILNTSEIEVSNERLEFLGDAILDSIVAEFLYERFPDENEGYLTKIKSKVVSRNTLGTIGHDMMIGDVLRYNKNRTIKMETIEGNAFEAIVGAIYLDAGYEATRKSIIHHVFRKYVNLNRILEEEIDFKSRLFIWSQKNRLPIEFEVLLEESDGANWKYVVRVNISEREYGRGSGSSKKKAEQAAAQETLELLGEM
ncbi:MAG: ribonuclease III [Crocinitomicaceae bacterium]|nr:ribonuclease III [Crocinitomicaceae bacterium]